MKKLMLTGKWSATGSNCVTNESLTLDASVPGSTLNDVITAKGFDPFWRTNADQIQKYESFDWHYSKEFELHTVNAHTQLVFEKLDTYCDVYLNGVHLGNLDNGHISYEFDVADYLKTGKNTIDVYFYSPISSVSGKPKLRGAFTTERMYTRRTQCSYGWDWVGRFVSCGICGDVYLKMYDKDEPIVDNVYVYTKSIDSMGAYVGISACFGENFANKVFDFEIYDCDGNKVKSHSKYCSYPKYSFNVSIEDAKLWYPTGYGEQPLYELRISCGGKILYSEKFGIRTVKILQTTDKEGSDYYKKCLELKKTGFSQEYDKNTKFSGFILVVNGVKILCRGANWVPCEPFENGRTKEKTSKILAMAKDMGLNMLRVWGGGTFETKEFYDECSRLGIMVTQDFLMACGSYPEKEQWFINQLNKEAEYAAKLIRNEPCLMWWSGDNENAINGDDTMADHPGRSSAVFGIVPVLMELDPERDFLPSSPYGGSFYASNTVGTTHNTQYLSYILDAIENKPLDNYKQLYKTLCARFIAEEPTFGSISTYSSKRFMTEDDIFGDDLSVMLYHTKGNPAMKKELFEYFVELTQKILGSFKDGYDRNFKMKYVQHECVRVVLEQLRREKWFCSGVIFWMLADCWPAAVGWTFIDYYLMPKASYYSFKRCSKPVVCSVDKNDGTYSVYVCNDGTQPCSTKLCVYAVDVKCGKTEQLYSGEACVPCGESQLVHSFEYSSDCIIVADTDNDRAFYKEGALNVCKTDVEYELGENSVTLKSKGYIQAVEIEGNVLPEDNYFSMLPGEQKTIKFTKAYADEAADIHISAYGIE